jgi:hypothetical protein
MGKKGFPIFSTVCLGAAFLYLVDGLTIDTDGKVWIPVSGPELMPIGFLHVNTKMIGSLFNIGKREIPI